MFTSDVCNSITVVQCGSAWSMEFRPIRIYHSTVYPQGKTWHTRTQYAYTVHGHTHCINENQVAAIDVQYVRKRWDDSGFGSFPICAPRQLLEHSNPSVLKWQMDDIDPLPRRVLRINGCFSFGRPSSLSRVTPLETEHTHDWSVDSCMLLKQ